MRKKLIINMYTVFLLCCVLLSFFALSCKNTVSEIEYDWQVKAVGTPIVWKKTMGENITVAVIDSGLNYDLLGNSFDKERILKSYNMSDSNNNLTDYTSHGTAMLTLIGANGENGFYGIAPKCKFIVIKALNSMGATNVETLTKSIDFAVENKANIINLSLGSVNNSEYVSSSIINAVKNNIAVVCAAGDQKEQNILYPAALTNTLSVAAIDVENQLYQSSNDGGKTDIFAPGVDIYVPKMNFNKEVMKVFESGSSVATAVFSGELALYLDYLQNYDIKHVYAFFRETKSTRTIDLTKIII